ncbi:MAG TPA: hypothetical protein PLN48_02890 [Lachnospiraceae bacterium]|nr:hypothetical protein [Lachnospiraceae bacterium]
MNKKNLAIYLVILVLAFLFAAAGPGWGVPQIITKSILEIVFFTGLVFLMLFLDSWYHKQK